VTGNPRRAATAAAASFAECYQADPEGTWFAPGRANLIGEHTDYNEGWVLPFALARGVVAAAARRGDGVLAVSSRQAPGTAVTARLDDLAPGSVTGWAAYPAGVAWALREAGLDVPGASLAIDSDLPQGAGLSSSAALECAVALALTGLAGLTVARPRLAALARRAENEFVGVPSGMMDQSASLLCEAGHALLLDCRDGGTVLVPFDPAAAGLRLLLVDTRARHELTGGEYASRRAECEEAARQLGVPSLRYATDARGALDRLGPVLRRRARHVISDNRRVHAVADLLRTGDIGAIGPLLTASHASLRDDFEVSWPEADVAVEAAAGGGALGARMIGGGFGGSVLALLPAARDSEVRAAIRAAYAGRGWPGPGFLDAVPSASAHRLS
jgi:galactokinase